MIQLVWNAEDLTDAIAAMPAGQNTERYLADLRAIEHELARRSAIQTYRRMLREWPADWTTYDRRTHYRHEPRTIQRPADANWLMHRRNHARSAAFSLAWYRLHPTQEG
jgi:hypothetical protein